MTILAKANGTRGELYIYESIGDGFFGGVTAQSVSEALKDLGKVRALDIYVNSDGGSVFDGIAIYNQLRRFDAEKTVHIDGIAASIASVIAMAADDRRIAENAMVMIHDPWGAAVGTSAEMRKYAESLDQVRETILDTYVTRTGGSRAEIGQWMSAETWMSAAEAVKRGFATATTESKALNARQAYPMLAKFRNVPKALQAARTPASLQLARMAKRIQQLNRGTAPATA